MDLVVSNLRTMQAIATDGDVSKWEHDDQYWMEPKYDGFRGLVIKDFSGTVHVLTRSLKSKLGNAPHIEEAVGKYLPAGTVLDGEFCFPKAYDPDGDPIACDFSKTSSIMGSKPAGALAAQAIHGKIHYVIFDILADEGHDMRHLTNAQRRWAAARAVDRMDDEFIHLAPCYDVDQEHIDWIIDAGGEGVVIKNSQATYFGPDDKNDRPKDTWYKVKANDTMDAVVVAFDAPQQFLPDGRVTRLYRDCLPGAVVFGQYKDGVLVTRGRCSGMELATREDMRDNPSNWLGSVIEVKHYGLTEDSCRHPQFVRQRDDKLASECLWD